MKPQPTRSRPHRLQTRYLVVKVVLRVLTTQLVARTGQQHSLWTKRAQVRVPVQRHQACHGRRQRVGPAHQCLPRSHRRGSWMMPLLRSNRVMWRWTRRSRRSWRPKLPHVQLLLLQPLFLKLCPRSRSHSHNQMPSRSHNQTQNHNRTQNHSHSQSQSQSQSSNRTLLCQRLTRRARLRSRQPSPRPMMRRPKQQTQTQSATPRLARPQQRQLTRIQPRQLLNLTLFPTRNLSKMTTGTQSPRH